MVAYVAEAQRSKPTHGGTAFMLTLVAIKIKKMIKKLNGNELELTYSGMNQGFRVTIEAKTPFSLFTIYRDDVAKLKEKLEEICDDWVEELGKDVHTHFTLPAWSFTTESIYLTREYSI